MADSGDELYTVRNNYALGNFQDAIAEAKSLRLRPDPALRLERDVYVYRSMVGLKNYKAVLDEIKEDGATAPSLRAVRVLAQYLAGGANKEAALALVEGVFLQDPALLENPLIQSSAAQIYLHEGNTTAALKVLKSPQTLEHFALLCQLYMRIDRPDLAEKSVKAMQNLDDEAALTTLSHAQLSLLLVSSDFICWRGIPKQLLDISRSLRLVLFLILLQGGDRVKEAVALFRELNDRFGGSVAGVNGLAAAYIAQKRFGDAERVLEELLETNPGQADALINMIAVYANTGRSPGPEASARLEALRSANPHHPYLTQMTSIENTFDRVAAGFAPVA
jgi:coatomer subunit epsilon